jgi:hypothetical protein
VLLTIVAGWALLPTVNFVPTEAPFPYWILGTALPAGYFVTKATITSLTALTGVLLFDPRAMRRFRLKWWDLPMMLWCALPLLSRIANHALNQGALREGLRGMLYQLLALGYFLLARPPVFLRRCLYPADLRLTLAAALLLAAIDNLMNSGMILPLVLVIGGMSAHSPAAGDVEAGVEDGPGFEKRVNACNTGGWRVPCNRVWSRICPDIRLRLHGKRQRLARTSLGRSIYGVRDPAGARAICSCDTF